MSIATGSPVIKQDFSKNGTKTADTSTSTNKEARGIVSRIDTKGSEEITLKRSTLWLLGVVFIAVQLAINYGGSLIGWARDDQTVKSDVKAMQKDMEDLKLSLKEMNERLVEERIQREKTAAFNTGLNAAGGK